MLTVMFRRVHTIQTRFEPTRLGREFLRLAYEMVVPIRRARVNEEPVSAKLRLEPVQNRHKGGHCE
jgi:hypothetical protein